MKSVKPTPKPAAEQAAKPAKKSSKTASKQTAAKPARTTAAKPAAKPARTTAAKPAKATTATTKAAAKPAPAPATTAKPNSAAVVTLPEPPTLNITGDPAADAELARNPFSLLAGMLLDQQFPMERAFAGPHVILQRLGADTLDPQTIAAYDPEAFVKLCQGPPAVHRYPGAMAARMQELARIVLDEYDGDATKIWSAGTAKEIVQRLRALPGFGAAKATIFLALLGKRFGVKPRGWVTETGPLGKPTAYRSVADVVDAESLAKVRATKQEIKKRAKQEKAG
jgi:uncharacterized HhH-GPD family protein